MFLLRTGESLDKKVLWNWSMKPLLSRHRNATEIAIMVIMVKSWSEAGGGLHSALFAVKCHIRVH